MPQDFPLVIIGGNNFIAAYLMKRLHASGFTAEIISRRPIDIPQGFALTEMDLTTSRNWIAPENAVVISLLPLWVLAQFLPRFIGVKSIIAVGSTSRFTKSGGPDKKDQEVAASLEAAENVLMSWCTRSNVTRTVLHPTLVYDGVHDKNVARMAKFISRFRMLPLAAPAKGLRQPIHADDVARAIVSSIGNPAAENKAFHIGGGEVLTYRAMAERVFMTQGLKPRLIMLPSEWLAKGFEWVAKTGIIKDDAFGTSVFQRMNEDLLFDFSEGLKILNYQPRKFEPAAV